MFDHYQAICMHSMNVSQSPGRLSRETCGMLVKKEFFTVGVRLIHVPGTWNVAPYLVPGDSVGIV